MKSKLFMGLATVLWLLGAATGVADLCQKCRGNFYITSVGVCVECKGATASEAFKLCRTCSAKLQECERCRVRLPKGKSDSGREAAGGDNVREGASGNQRKRMESRSKER